MTGRAERRDERDEPRRLDREQYPWQWQVQDRFGRARPLGFGTTTTVNDQGETVTSMVGVGPDYWTADEQTCEHIAFAMRGVCQRVRDENKRRRDEQAEPGS